MGLVYRQISLLAQLYKTCIGECNRSHPTEQHCWQKQQRCTDDKKKKALFCQDRITVS